jgi:hypothetical protein
MWRKISWKALALSNVANFAAAVVVLLLWASGAEIVLYLSGRDASFRSAIEMGGSSLTAMILFIGCASIAGGYVGGRIAKRKYLLYGALGTAVAALMSFCELAFGPLFGQSDGPAWLETLSNILTLFVGPLLGAYGGHLAGLRQVSLDAMAAEGRQPHDLWRQTLVITQWIAACVVAAVVYLVVFAIGAHMLGFFRWLPALASMAAIMAGSFVFPPQHRSAGCLLLVALAIATPLAVLLGHVSVGDANYGHSFLVVYNAVGALLTYQVCAQGRSKHWWWLSTRNFAGFSKMQRTARLYLTFVGFVVGLLLYVAMLAVANSLGADPHLTIVTFVITVPIGFIAARPLCRFFWPDMLEQADNDAYLNFAQLGSAFD